MQNENINREIKPRIQVIPAGSSRDAAGPNDDTISLRSAAKSVQYQATGLQSFHGDNTLVVHRQMNATSNSMGKVKVAVKPVPQVDVLMEAIGELEGDAQDEYEASKSRH